MSKHCKPGSCHAGMISKFCRQDSNPLRAAMIVYLMMQEQKA